MNGSAIAHAGRALDADPGTAALAVSLAKARATETAKLAVIRITSYNVCYTKLLRYSLTDQPPSMINVWPVVQAPAR